MQGLFAGYWMVNHPVDWVDHHIPGHLRGQVVGMQYLPHILVHLRDQVWVIGGHGVYPVDHPQFQWYPVNHTIKHMHIQINICSYNMTPTNSLINASK